MGAWRSLPGDELDLSEVMNRALTLNIVSELTGVIVRSFGEVTLGTPIRIENYKRGTVEINFCPEHLSGLEIRQLYRIEILAYGQIYGTYLLERQPPEPGTVLLNGIEIYGSPRQVLEVVGKIPFADIQTNVDLSAGWVKNDLGYWVKTIPAEQELHGFWVHEFHVKGVEYEELATDPSNRAYSRVATDSSVHTLYYRGYEKLDSVTQPILVETAYSIYVWRCLLEATQKIEIETGRFFNLRRIIRETHRGLRRQRQLALRQTPVQQPDSQFILDCYSNGRRGFFRRFDLEDFDNNRGIGGNSLHLDSETGIVTVNQNRWDWNDVGNRIEYGTTDWFPGGENNLEVSYKAGYKTLPPDIDEIAAIEGAMRQAQYWQMLLTQGLTGISIGCVNLNFGQLFNQFVPGWEKRSAEVIDRYRRISIESFGALF
ncbi:MAG: hypothetical protein LRZ84_14395 [Desertifilum sp.]|nr:hypothetical protein [Desertifilum sp.]